MILKGSQGLLELFQQLLMRPDRVAVFTHRSDKLALPLNYLATSHHVAFGFGQFQSEAFFHWEVIKAHRPPQLAASFIPVDRSSGLSQSTAASRALSPAAQLAQAKAFNGDSHA